MADKNSTVAPIIILGASFAGVTLTHTLLRNHLIPSKASGHAVPKIIVIAPNTHTYWNPAAVRAIVTYETVPEEKLFVPIAEGFKQYEAENSDLFQIVHGRADRVEFGSKTVTITKYDDDDKPTGTDSFTYGHLVIATGATQQPGTPYRFAAGEGHKKTQALLKEWQAKIEAANEILISGGGPTGVETASEIKRKYPTKKIRVVTAAESVLAVRRDVDDAALALLAGAGIEVVLQTKITGSESRDGKTVVKAIGSGSDLEFVVDLYIPAHGVIPNTQFLPKEILSSGWVKVDKYLHVEGYEDVWTAGDVTTAKYKVAGTTTGQVPIVSHNLAVTLDLPSLIPSGGCSLWAKKPDGLREYTPMTGPELFVPIAGSGTGVMKGWKAMGWMVNAVKGKTLFVDFNNTLVNGGSFYVKKD